PAEAPAGAAPPRRAPGPRQLAAVRPHPAHPKPPPRAPPAPPRLRQGADPPDGVLEPPADPDALVGLLRRAVDRDRRAGKAGPRQRVGPGVGHQRGVGRDPGLDTGGGEARDIVVEVRREQRLAQAEEMGALEIADGRTEPLEEIRGEKGRLPGAGGVARVHDDGAHRAAQVAPGRDLDVRLDGTRGQPRLSFLERSGEAENVLEPSGVHARYTAALARASQRRAIPYTGRRPR